MILCNNCGREFDITLKKEPLKDIWAMINGCPFCLSDDVEFLDDKENFEVLGV